MPFENHDQAKEVLGKDKESSEENFKEEAMGHEEEEDKSEIRNIPNKEVRTFNVENLELRVDIDNKTVVGYGAVFGSLSNDLGGFREVIDPNAFEGRLEDDVRFLINHDGLPLARTTNKTLRLSIDEKGLRYEATMPDTTLSNDLMELLKNGTVSQSSFAFIVEDDSWEVKDGVNIRTINKVSRLFDVSAVTYPAYEEASSSVALRSLEEWKEEESNKKLKDNLEKEKKENLKEMQDLHKRNLAELKLKLIK
jgi:HK97 family phage prohead protease